MPKFKNLRGKMKKFWKNKKVLVTGGAGFIGSHVVEQLVKKGARVTITTKSNNLDFLKEVKGKVIVLKSDLTNPRQAVLAVRGQEIVMNLASKVAGIKFNVAHPATMFSDNILIAKNVTHAAAVNNVERFLVVSSACVYPRFCTIPTPENEGFIDDPEPTNLGYGWAKRVAELLGRFYAQEFGLKVAIARPYNAYGPRDDFNPETSHVIPGLVKRVFDGENPLKVWGSGKQTRSFLYVDDFARGLIETVEKYPNCDPVNIGSSQEITIENLAKLIVKLSGIETKIEFDTSKPDGQPRRNCNTKKANKRFGFKARVPLKTGLKKTILWYKRHLSS